MKILTTSGVILAVLGLLGFAIPMFTTQQTKDIANIGDLKLQTTEKTSHVVTPMLAGGTLILGLVLIGVGVTQKR